MGEGEGQALEDLSQSQGVVGEVSLWPHVSTAWLRDIRQPPTSSTTDLGLPQPSQLARKEYPTSGLCPLHTYMAVGPECLFFPDKMVDFCLVFLKWFLHSSNQDRAQETELSLEMIQSVSD